jgi:formylglycine-generating enzyme required for sulfatase activity
MHRRAAISAVLVLALIAVIPLVRARFLPDSPLPESITKAARNGVARNGEWVPVIQALDGVEMALVPAGCFTMGSTDDQLVPAFESCDRYYGVYGCREDFADEQPAHEVCIGDPFWIDVREVSNRRYGSSSSTNMISMYRGPEWPRETVAWDQAAAYCAGRGGRLPREAEWEFAARGPDNLIYPWGDAFTDQYMGRAMGSPSDVGSEADDVSWVGAVDLGGSVSEWVADWYGPYSADR